jgi:ABC-type antimicrobial peptide transport system permease subunit
MVLRESLFVCAAGIALGVPLALWGSRLRQSRLFGLTPQDPWAFGGALIAIVLVTLGASLLLARRVSSVDPMVALRYE